MNKENYDKTSKDGPFWIVKKKYLITEILVIATYQ